MKREVFGVFSIYGSYVLPLEVAHKVQMLLAEHGFRHDYIHNDGSRIETKRIIDVPEVRVVKGQLLDATTLTDSEYEGWVSNIKEARTINKECEILAPAQFKLVRGE